MSNTLPQDPDVSKLLSIADNVVTNNQAYERVRFKGAKLSNPAYGKLNKSIQHLQETAEHFCKAGQP